MTDKSEATCRVSRWLISTYGYRETHVRRQNRMSWTHANVLRVHVITIIFFSGSRNFYIYREHALAPDIPIDLSLPWENNSSYSPGMHPDSGRVC